MNVLFDDVVDVEHTFISLQADDFDVELDHIAARTGQTNGLCGARYPRALSMVIGSRFGAVPLRVELHEHAPPVPDDFEDVVDVSLQTSGGDQWIVAVNWARNIGPLPGAGTSRARWCAIGMDEARDGTLPADHDPDDDTVWERYLLQLWPAPPEPDAVVRQGSAHAACWHQQASGEPLTHPLTTGPSKKHRPGNEPLGTYRGRLTLAAGRTWFLHDPGAGTPHRDATESGAHLGSLTEDGAYFVCGHDEATVDVTVEVYRRTPAFPNGWSDVDTVDAFVPSRVAWVYSPPTPQEGAGSLRDIALPDERVHVRAAVDGWWDPVAQTETWLLHVWPNDDRP